MTEIWPKPLQSASGPMRADKLVGAAAGMGDFGPCAQTLAAQGLVPPDMMTGLTLFLLTQQPRDPVKAQSMPGGGGGVAGGVWVRERFTIHQPLHRDDVFTASGESVGRHVHKGRRYGTNRCRTVNAAGQLVGSNLTTGLLQYKVQDGLVDGIEGIAPDAVAAPEADWQAARANPCLDVLRALTVGQALGGEAVCISLDLMTARDTAKPDNPIHSNPELARKAGLSKPIAGGSHVLSFALDVVMQATGVQALLHGAHFDVRWKAPVYADLVVHPSARVSSAEPDRVVFALSVELASGGTAMTGELTVPLS